MNKYGAKKTYSELCRREFDSKGEATRAEQLCLLEKAGEIKNLEYQIPFVLCEKPKISLTLDFSYEEPNPLSMSGYRWKRVYEDFKGMLTRDSRTKLAWLKAKYNVSVKLIRREDL